MAFTCERPSDKGGVSGCGIIWQKESYESDEINPKNGNLVWKATLEERFAGKTNRKYMMPKIAGRYISDMQRETNAARKAAGVAASYNYQPQSFGLKPDAAKKVEPIVVPEAPKPVTGGR
jgi:hypothetical protein